MIAAGSVYAFRYPFVLESVTVDYDEGGPIEGLSWRPGVRFEQDGPDSFESVADGDGLCEFTVVSIHKPGPRYPERVFFTRRFQDPAGKWFGKPDLRVTTLQTFSRRIKGYRYAYSVLKPEAA
jgi:hypothetical protein